MYGTPHSVVKMNVSNHICTASVSYPALKFIPSKVSNDLLRFRTFTFFRLSLSSSIFSPDRFSRPRFPRISHDLCLPRNFFRARSEERKKATPLRNRAAAFSLSLSLSPSKFEAFFPYAKKEKNERRPRALLFPPTISLLDQSWTKKRRVGTQTLTTAHLGGF